ncbi:MAG: SufE family protein [Bacteroidales bacterium]|nr:SufE family protein [Bacteroidales bacterium]
MTIREIQNQIIEDFEVFDDWMDKYNLLIELSKELPELDSTFRTEQYVIKGCQSKVWLVADLHDGKIQFKADSDAIIVKGIVALMVKVLSNQTPADILDSDLYFINQIGLKENLSPTRSNGLLAMIKQMKLYALAYQTRISGKS